MSVKTSITWCDSTVNGSSGCDGCELWNTRVRTCYAGQLHERRFARTMPDKYAADFREVRMIPGRFAKAAKWSDLRGKQRPGKPWLDGLPRHIFVGDMGDILSRAVTDAFLEDELLAAIMSEPGRRHIWLILTKRPARLAALSHKWQGLPENVVALTTITDQRTADTRIPHLLDIHCRWRGLSCEPLLGPVHLGYRGAGAIPIDEGGHRQAGKQIDWAIVGGESGPASTRREMSPDWARTIRDQCSAAGVAFFFKQFSGRSPADTPPALDGHTHTAIPTHP